MEIKWGERGGEAAAPARTGTTRPEGAGLERTAYVGSSEFEDSVPSCETEEVPSKGQISDTQGPHYHEARCCFF